MLKLFRTMLLIIVLALPLAIIGISQPQPAAAQSSCTQSHTVQAGENLFRIGLRYGVSWTVLQAYNYLSNPNLIYVGQVLCINGYASSPPATPTPVTIYPGNPFGPTTQPRIYFPQATLGVSFQLVGYNFPPNRQVTIGITTLGNRPYIPYYTTTTDASGQFYVEVPIPPTLANANTIAVEATTSGGYYALNWFYNR